MYPYFNKQSSKFKFQHCLITMIEKWQQSSDVGGQEGALLTNLSKAFDHDILIAKIYAYGCDKTSLYFINAH